MKRFTSCIIITVLFTAQLAIAESLTSDEKELFNRIETILQGYSVAQWGIIFAPVLTSTRLTGQVGKIVERDWEQVSDASKGLKKITVCQIVNEIDLYTTSGEKTASGEDFFKQARATFDKDCK